MTDKRGKQGWPNRPLENATKEDLLKRIENMQSRRQEAIDQRDKLLKMFPFIEKSTEVEIFTSIRDLKKNYRVFRKPEAMIGRVFRKIRDWLTEPILKPTEPFNYQPDRYARRLNLSDDFDWHEAMRDHCEAEEHWEEKGYNK